MAVSIDRVYQKVLALANKEQRGYITPQEFNLFADHAQMEIFEQYFYDLDQFSRLPGTGQIYADKVKNLREKTDLFQTFSPSRVEVINASGWMNLYDHAFYSEPGARGNDLYRIGRIQLDYESKGLTTGASQNFGAQAQYSTSSELTNYANSKLLKRDGGTARYEAPTYRQFTFNGIDRLQIHPFPEKSYVDNDYSGNNYTYVGEDGNKRVYPDRIQIFYTRKPKNPNWAYVVVNNKPLYNSTSSQDFELHAAEETELVYRILTLAGIAIEKPQLSQMAGALGGAQIQQEKQ